jgi:hypothetical protein
VHRTGSDIRRSVTAEDFSGSGPDHVIVWNEAHLERLLRECVA